MVELKPTEALVGDPEAGEGTDPAARPDVRPHGRRDRVRRAGPAMPVLGRVPAEHGRTG